MAASEYEAGNVDFLTLITAWREVLQIELQVVQFETELGKSLASLERAVGVQLNEHPPAMPAPTDVDTTPPPPPNAPGPFEPEEAGEIPNGAEPVGHIDPESSGGRRNG